MAAPQHSSSELGSAFGLHINWNLEDLYGVPYGQKSYKSLQAYLLDL